MEDDDLSDFWNVADEYVKCVYYIDYYPVLVIGPKEPKTTKWKDTKQISIK